MTERDWPEPLIRFVHRLDPGGQARLRHSAEPVVLFMVPGLASLLRNLEGGRLEDALLVARIAAIMRHDGPKHPARALAEARFDYRRMRRLLVSGQEVLPERLITVARFLDAKGRPAKVAPFYKLTAEVRWDRSTRVRAGWAMEFSGFDADGSKEET